MSYNLFMLQVEELCRVTVMTAQGMYEHAPGGQVVACGNLDKTLSSPSDIYSAVCLRPLLF